VKVTNLNTGTLTSFTAPSSSLSFGPTGNGDFVSEMWVSSDPDGWPQAYIQICQLPLTGACTLPSFSGTTGRGSFTNGYVQVDLAYTFTWVPLFQNRLGGVIDAGFQRMTTLVTTSTRTYAE
jgi:hypothetical protein